MRQTVHPSIPREAWPSHAHYPSQVLLLGSHENFRRVSRALVDGAEADADPSEIGRVYHLWKSAMRSHEAYEEYKLYPFLARRWSVSMNAARAGHEALKERDRGVRAALLATVEPDVRVLSRALAAHDQTLTEHLELEENLVIPLLLALEPEEFRRFTNT